jgi:peptide/nickel transport system substrate-binding protein
VFGTSDVAILALKKGSIDMFWWPIQPGYMDDLERQPKIRLFTNEKAPCTSWDSICAPPFNDPALREAVAYLIDKDFIVSRFSRGRAPRCFRWCRRKTASGAHDDLPHYGDGMSRETRIKTAYRLLVEAGYSGQVPPVDAAGNIQPGQRDPAARRTHPGAVYHPDAAGGLRSAPGHQRTDDPGVAPGTGHARLRPSHVLFLPAAAGQGQSRLSTPSSWATGALRLDPDYVRNLFHSTNDKPRGWNMSGYRNPAFDEMADRSASEMDPVKRQALVMEMQKLIARDLPYIPVVQAFRGGGGAPGPLRRLGGDARRHRQYLVHVPGKPVNGSMGLETLHPQTADRDRRDLFRDHDGAFRPVPPGTRGSGRPHGGPVHDAGGCPAAHGEHGAGPARVDPVPLFT